MLTAPLSPPYRTLWQLILDAGAAISVHLSPTLRHYAQETGIPGWDWFGLTHLLTFAPEGATAAQLLARTPYTSSAQELARFASAQERGWVVKTAAVYHPGEVYRLTPPGRENVQQFIDDLRTMMAVVDPLPAEQGDHLAGLLDQLVQASLATPPPPNPWGISLSYRLMPRRIPPLPFVEQAISCLAAYRDDAHLAAWQSSGLSGPAIEALTLLWRARTASLEGLHTQLARRGHPRAVYAEALADLRAYGYLEGAEETLALTESGRAFRQQVEEDTDRFFFAPWAGTSDAELSEMADLLTQLINDLRAA